MKATRAAEARRLTDIPNVGPAFARDLELLGVRAPADLVGQDAFQLYQQLRRTTGVRQDPCVLDTFLAVVDFMSGAEPRPWWHYTPERRTRFPDLEQ